MDKRVRTKVLIIGDYTDQAISKVIAQATGVKQSIFLKEDSLNPQLQLNCDQTNSHVEFHFYRDRHFERATPPEVDVVLVVGNNADEISHLANHIHGQQRHPFFAIFSDSNTNDYQLTDEFAPLYRQSKKNFARLQNLVVKYQYNRNEFLQAFEMYKKNDRGDMQNDPVAIPMKAM